MKSHYMKLHNLSKKYGKTVALNKFSFAFKKGKIYGVLGFNGSGKTTLLGILSGMVKSFSGKVTFSDRKTFSKKLSEGFCSLMPQDADLPFRFSPKKLFNYFVMLEKNKVDNAELDSLIKGFGLLPFMKKNVFKLSHGTKKKINIIQALLFSKYKDLILFDEPTSGFDISVVRVIKEKILALKKKKIIIMTSHRLKDLEDVCDYLIIMDKGRVKFWKNLSKTHRVLTLKFKGELKGDIPKSIKVSGNSLKMSLSKEHDCSSLLKFVNSEKITVEDVRTDYVSEDELVEARKIY